MSLQTIIMADVVGSSGLDAGQLSSQLARQVAGCNQELADRIASPLTITLGDEFQGLVGALPDAVACLFHLEEALLRDAWPFRLRYVVHEGEIATPINRDTAYGMLGPGLTRARTLLADKQESAAYAREVLGTEMRGRVRFLFDLLDRRLAEVLTRLFCVVDGIEDRWHSGDCALVADMLARPNNEKVAVRHGKNRSQIWKRRASLMVEEYRNLRAVIQYLSQQPAPEEMAGDDRPRGVVGLRHR